jgi:hypothetical protein
MRTLWAAAFTLGLGAACGPARLTETRRAAIVDSVEQVVHGVLDAANHATRLASWAHAWRTL